MASRAKEKEYFLENLVMLTESGMDIVSSLEVIHGELRNPDMRKLVATMKDAILSGEPIHAALDQS